MDHVFLVLFTRTMRVVMGTYFVKILLITHVVLNKLNSMKKLRTGQLCTINGHIYQVKKDWCITCAFSKTRCTNIPCISTIGWNNCFKLIK